MLIKTKLNDLSVSNSRFVIHERNATFLPFTVYVYLVQEGKYTVLASSSRELLLLQWLVSNESPTHGPENRCCLYNAICFTSSSTSLSIVSSRRVRWLNRKTVYEEHSFIGVYKHRLIRSPYSFFHFYKRCVYTIREENVAIRS